MKNLFITLFLIGMSMVVCSQDYYWYEGTKIPLERGCRMYIIYEDDKLSDSDKSHITYSADVFYNDIPNLKWGTTNAHAVIKDTAHVHYSTISYRKDGDYYDNMFVTHRFYVKLKNQEDLPLLQELAAQNNAEIEESGALPAWYILRCKLDAPKNALELANLFYETTDLFSAAEPEMINTIMPEFPKAIKSLCEEWHVLDSPIRHEARLEDVYQNLFTIKYRITTDTIIEMKHCVKLYKEDEYVGALYEEEPSRLMFIPKSSSHPYLLYAFNVQVGDALNNLWVEGYSPETFMSTYPNGWTMTVREIQETTPRTYVLSYTDSVSYPYYQKSIVWLEGVGYQAGPIGSDVPFHFEIFTPQLLCAYENGEQVYTSEMGQKYGCEYNGNANISSDTIPLYKDGPGSSTVEPVDPNQIYATLNKDILSLYEKMNMEIGFTLYKTPSANQTPAVKRTIKATTFNDSVSTTITESGYYTIELTNPTWDYTIIGTFEYQVPQAVENTVANTPAATKILRDGQLILMYEGKIYNVQGQQIQ